jgi:hypothetical protein
MAAAPYADLTTLTAPPTATNGRVSLATPAREPVPRDAAGTSEYRAQFSYRTETAASEGADQIRGNLQATPLNTAYFSPANVQIVQNKIRREVYDRSEGEFLIDPQSADELMIVMRAMYLQYGRNMPDRIPEQIAELNQIVADWCVPRILSECSMHRTYLHDLQNLPVPLAHPVMLTKTGSKSATFDRFF